MEQRALIIFAKFPHPGQVKTRLGEAIGMAKAAAIYREFAEHAFLMGDELRAFGVRVYLFFAPENDTPEIEGWVRREFRCVRQRGETLGDRMKAAFDLTFGEGAQRTIVIGTDVPELDTETLLHAFEALSTHDIVIGPSTDGGYYLLGMNNPAKPVFEGIVWSTPLVYAATLERIEDSGLSLYRLPVLSDIDTEDDYRKYLMRLGKKSNE